MNMENKDNNFVAFEKRSKANKKYFNGEVRIDGKLYWVSIFEKVSVKGDKYLSGVLNEKGVVEKPVEKQEQQNDEWINDDIPF